MLGHTQYVVRVSLLLKAILVDWRSFGLEQVPCSKLYHKSAICPMQLALLSTYFAGQQLAYHLPCHV